MKTFELPMGKNGGYVRFEITEGQRLHLQAAASGEVYDLTFSDCIYTNRYTHDPFMYKNSVCANAYTDETEVTVTGNQILFTTGKNASITQHNLFTVSQEYDAFELQTYFTANGDRIYDCAFISGRADVEKGFFDRVYLPSKNGTFDIDTLTSPVSEPGALVLKGKNRYLKASGGLVEFNGGFIDTHSFSVKHIDDLSYYGKANPLVSRFAFEDVEISTDKAIPASTDIPAAFEIIRLDAGRMKAQLALDAHTLSTVCDGKHFPLCAMRLRDLKTTEDFYIDTLSHWESVSAVRNGNYVVFTLSDCVRDITLKLTAELSGAENQIAWQTEVINHSDDYSLIWCTYPRLYVKEDRFANVFEPIHGGNVRKGFTSCYQYTAGTYPSGFFYTMPYLALFEDTDNPKDSTYFSVHDESGALKEFCACCDHDHIVRFTSRFHAENLTLPRNSNKLPGKAIWKRYDGDWYDATNFYRDFVNSSCDWGKEETEKNTPEWMLDIPFWIMDWVPYDATSDDILPTNLRHDGDDIHYNDWYENAIKLQDELGIPIGYHVYNWHQIPFNNDYPHFVPARERYLQGHKELKKHGIRIMPYINSLLWDTKDRGYEVYLFESVGRQGAVKLENGDVETLIFESKEANGEPVKLAPMCPTTKVWKETELALIQDMYDKYDFDAIYLDQIAARIPHRCMDKNHGHPLGGGSWWQEGYNDMLRALNAAKPADKGFSTECNAEVYTNNMDAYLSWCWQLTDGEVPAFMRLYSDKVIVFGRNTNGRKKTDTMYWKYNTAMAFVGGQQLGWINADVVNDDARMPLLKKLARFRYENRLFFRKFVTLRPPVAVISADNTVRDSETKMAAHLCGKHYFCTGVLTNGNKTMMLIVNVADRDITSDIMWRAEEYNFQSGQFKVFGSGSVNSLTAGKANITVKKESFICIEF